MDEQTGCPEDYAELFEAYFPMMIGVVASAGIEPFDVQDVAMDILARFIEKEGLAYYDPEYLHDVGDNPQVPGPRLRKAKFKGMLRGFTATYVMQYRDKQMTRHRREPWRTDAPVQVEGMREHTTWLEANFADEATYEILDSEVSISIVTALRKAKESLDEKATQYRDYPRFIALCVEHGYLDGRLDRRALERELGVASSTVSAMLKELRTTLRPLLSEVGVISEVA